MAPISYDIFRRDEQLDDSSWPSDIEGGLDELEEPALKDHVLTTARLDRKSGRARWQSQSKPEAMERVV